MLFVRSLELLFLSFYARKSAILTNFCNTEIPGLRIGENGRDPGTRDPEIAISTFNSSSSYPTTYGLTTIHALYIQTDHRRHCRHIVFKARP